MPVPWIRNGYAKCRSTVPILEANCCRGLRLKKEGAAAAHGSEVVVENFGREEFKYLEPKCPLFLKVNPPKQGLNSNQNKGHLGSR